MLHVLIFIWCASIGGPKKALWHFTGLENQSKMGAFTILFVPAAHVMYRNGYSLSLSLEKKLSKMTQVHAQALTAWFVRASGTEEDGQQRTRSVSLLGGKVLSGKM